MSDDSRPLLRLGHSPDPDDAFMWWPLFDRDGKPPCINTGRFRFAGVTADIETLNQNSEVRGRQSAGSENDFSPLEITAISCAQYPHVKDWYVLTACGASMGERYGPKLVSRAPMTVSDLGRGMAVIAVPGERTSAFLAASMLIGRGRFRHAVVPFEQIIDRVSDGTFDAGLIIHEGQLTYESAGLHLVQDLGAWWWDLHQLPLPLGVNVIRRDLEQRYGSGALAEITATLLRSIRYALAHRRESVDYAIGFARNLASELTDQFISMYVNKRTLDMGSVGRRAVKTFLQTAHAAGLVPDAGEIEVVEPAAKAAASTG